MTGKVERLILKNFTAFEQAGFSFSSGINVLIGANSTGKTHVLKVIYTILKSLQPSQSPNALDQDVLVKLPSVFKTETLANLFRKQHTAKPELIINYGSEQYTFNLDRFMGLDTYNFVVPAYPKSTPDSVLFIPSREFLSLYEGFISAYTRRENTFDETYYDLAIALNANPLRANETTDSLLKPLKKIIGGKIGQENGKFYITLPEGKLESHLVSEGYRKIAMLLYLIRNGSIAPNGFLLWDEPEATLNPKMVTVIVDLMITLAKAGVQIFIATHDYLLSQELSLRAEYNQDVPMKFFALHKPNKRAGVQVESGDTLADLDHNPILEEFAAHYEREARLFNRTTKTKS